MSKEDKCGKNKLEFVTGWRPIYKNRRQVLFEIVKAREEGYPDSIALVARSNNPNNDEFYVEQVILSIKVNGELVFHELDPQAAEMLGLKLDKDNFIVQKKIKKQTRTPSSIRGLIAAFLSEHAKV